MSVLAAPKSLHFAEWSWELEAGGARGWQMPVAVWSSVCLLCQSPSGGISESQLCPVPGGDSGGFLQGPLGGSGIGPWLL